MEKLICLVCENLDDPTYCDPWVREYGKIPEKKAPPHIVEDPPVETDTEAISNTRKADGICSDCKELKMRKKE